MAKVKKFDEVEAVRFIDAAIEHKVTPDLSILFSNMETPDKAKVRIEAELAKKAQPKAKPQKDEKDAKES